jgi:hypothetical protein
MNKSIKGKIDKHGFAYINTEIINPNTDEYAFEVKTIIDTGSAYTLVKPELLNGINVTNSIKDDKLLHPTMGYVKSKTFKINLKINNIIIPQIEVRELKDSNYPCGIIIGIDIIKHCDFQYNSKSKTFQIDLMTNI